MNPTERFYVYIAVVILAFLSSIKSFSSLDRPFKIISVLLGTTVISELTAHILAKFKGNNMPVFHFYTPALLILTSMYYNYSSPLVRKYRIACIVSCTGLIAATLNTVFLQPIETFNSNFILFTGCCITGMALISFYQHYVDTRSASLFGNPNFVLSLVFLFYWSATFVSYALHTAIERNGLRAYIFVWFVNILTYGSIAIVYFQTRRRQKLLIGNR